MSEGQDEQRLGALEDDEPLRLSERDFTRLIEGIQNPPPPSDRLRAAVAAGLGFAQGDEWSVADFNAEKDADIARENSR